jgi:hypothetical protein
LMLESNLYRLERSVSGGQVFAGFWSLTSIEIILISWRKLTF